MHYLVLPTLLAGLTLLVVGGELLVRGASRTARRLGLSPLVIGLTVVAFGTSAPELAVSINSALGGDGDLALGNVVGSNIFNILGILGLTAVITPLAVSRKLLRLDVPAMIAASVVTLWMGLDGAFDWLDGAILATGLLAYVAWSIWDAKRQHSSGAVHDDSPEPRRSLGASLLMVGLGLGLLVLGSRWFVHGAADIARALGVSELVIGLTVVAVGTSAPEIVTSVVAALRGERDIAVGNVVGSNLFNVLAVLGVTAMVAPGGVGVSPAAAAVDLPVMVLVAFVALPMLWTGHQVSRWEGGLLLAGYAAYTTWLVLSAVGHWVASSFGLVMAAGVVPAVLALVGLSSWRWWRDNASSTVPDATEGGAG